MKTTICERIAALRAAMKEQNIQAYIIPTTDPHLSEYPAACWKYREWISGFTGSAGTVVVTLDKAGLWTDSRYFLQAEMQLEGTGIDLYKLMLPETPSIPQFLLAELGEGDTVGLNGLTYSLADAQSLELALKKKGVALNTDLSLIDPIWKDRPAVPEAQIFEMPVELSGKSSEDKLIEINQMLHKAGADCTVLSALDEVAWTANIRGTDVSYNPVAISYAYVSDKENVLFINPKKVPAEIAEHLKKEGWVLADYGKLFDYLQRLPENIRVFLDRSKTNMAIYNALPKGAEIIDGISPANHLKSIKNETQLAGTREAMIRDGVALVRFFRWLEQNIESRACTAHALIRGYVYPHANVMLSVLKSLAFLPYHTVKKHVLLRFGVLLRPSAALRPAGGLHRRGFRMIAGRCDKVTSVIIDFIRLRRIVHNRDFIKKRKRTLFKIVCSHQLCRYIHFLHLTNQTPLRGKTPLQGTSRLKVIYSAAALLCVRSHSHERRTYSLWHTHGLCLYHATPVLCNRRFPQEYACAPPCPPADSGGMPLRPMYSHTKTAFFVRGYTAPFHRLYAYKLVSRATSCTVSPQRVIR